MLLLTNFQGFCAKMCLQPFAWGGGLSEKFTGGEGVVTQVICGYLPCSNKKKGSGTCINSIVGISSTISMISRAPENGFTTTSCDR